ncbi:MAG: PBP1A family penicillin-binding protein [Alphaproteobacteria bacterium]|nr:PBP1A family penicillin-binding protein [Alphaproteobacteria bacterium]
MSLRALARREQPGGQGDSPLVNPEPATQWPMTKTRRKPALRRRARARRPRPRTAARMPLVLRYGANAGAAVLMGLAALAVFVAFFARDLPSTDGLWARQRAPKIALLAIDGSPMPVRGVSTGAPVRLADLPRYVPEAVLAVEDRNFYHHIGVNPLSVLRAAIVDARAGAIREGGSTITQQLAKNLFLSPERTLKRKVQELLLALWLERKFTKDEILTLYLNRVYFGAGAYGVDAASRRYFGKPAKDLKLGEAAILAALLKAPSRLSPMNNPDDAGARAGLVINEMQEAGFITAQEARAARAEPVILAAPDSANAPYFTDYVLQEARELTDDIDADLVIQTTFDPAMQAALEEGLAAGLRKEPLAEDIQAAAVILDAEGGVRAMIGGRDYAQSQFNRAAQARRQPGSAFKPVVYLAALEAGYAPEDRVLDAPVTIGSWSPANYNDRYFGEVSLTTALQHSLNGATVRVEEAVGRTRVRLMARRLGIEGALTKGPALALGVDAVSPLELGGVYAAFANGGFRVAPHAIDSIRTSDGEVLYRRPTATGEAAASFRSVAMLNDMLAEVVKGGTGRRAAISGWRACGKTGTTQDSRDAWFAGHVGGLVGVVWVGRDDNAPMRKITGGGAPAVIWHEAMSRALLAHQAPAVRIAPHSAGDAPSDQPDPVAALLQAPA